MSSNSSFIREITKVAITQICNELDFHSVQENALNLLVDLFQQYIEEIGYRSHLLAELNLRSEANFGDVENALKSVNVSVGDISHFFVDAEDMEFGREIPQFPARSTTKSAPPSKKAGESGDLAKKEKEPLPDYVPSFLPAFPAAHTYKQTDRNVERTIDQQQLRKLKAKEKTHIETQLAKFHEKLTEAMPVTEESEYKVDKPKGSTANSVTQTPVDKSSPYFHKRTFYQGSEEKKGHGEMEEERQKKRSRAQSSLSSEFSKDGEEEGEGGKKGSNIADSKKS